MDNSSLLDKRSVSIDLSIIKQAVKNAKALDALTFVLQLKANYINSALYQWSFRKVMELCHCNFAKAKEIVGTAIRIGWVEERQTKEGYKYLAAKKLTHNKQKRVVFHVVKSKAGVQIYFEQDRSLPFRVPVGNSMEKQMARLVIESWNAIDLPSYNKAKNSKTIQTFRDVRNKILQAIFIEYIQTLQKPLNAVKPNRRGMVAADEATIEFAENYLMHGVSYKKIAKQFGNLNLTEYQISNIVKSLKEERLVHVNKANMPYVKLGPDWRGWDTPETPEFMEWDDDKGCVKDVFNRCFYNKYAECECDEAWFYKRMARVYRSKAKIVKQPQKRKGGKK